MITGDKYDGGPAFPRPDSQDSCGSQGMSLRDWFAGQALTTVLRAEYEQAKADAKSCGENIPGVLGWWANGGAEDEDFREYSTAAYGIADAMLIARNKPTE